MVATGDRDTNPETADSPNGSGQTVGWSWVGSARTVLYLVLCFKLAGVVLTTWTGLNVFAQSDVTTFAASAELFAEQIASGDFPTGNIRSVMYTWPLTLSVFWLLPGPSWIYARVFVAALGGVAIYNVYLVVRYHHSANAGFLAVLPMILFPSFIFVHGSILRESVILVGFTIFVRLLFLPEGESRRVMKYVAVVAILAVITVFRIPNLFVYVLVLVPIAIGARRDTPSGRSGIVTVIVGGVVTGTVYLLWRFRDGVAIVSYISNQRASRSHGDAVYLPGVVPETAVELVVFSWIGALYFLFAPLPWMITEPAWIVAGLESVVNFVYVLFGFLGFRHLYRQSKSFTLSLVVGFVAGVLMYGLIEGNVGPAIRHRQQFVWMAYALGAVGMVESISIET